MEKNPKLFYNRLHSSGRASSERIIRRVQAMFSYLKMWSGKKTLKDHAKIAKACFAIYNFVQLDKFNLLEDFKNNNVDMIRKVGENYVPLYFRLDRRQQRPSPVFLKNEKERIEKKKIEFAKQAIKRNVVKRIVHDIRAMEKADPDYTTNSYNSSAYAHWRRFIESDTKPSYRGRKKRKVDGHGDDDEDRDSNENSDSDEDHRVDDNEEQEQEQKDV